MEVVQTKDGFAFLFNTEESTLGLHILNGFVPLNKESQYAIEKAKFLLASLGCPESNAVN